MCRVISESVVQDVRVGARASPSNSQSQARLASSKGRRKTRNSSEPQSLFVRVRFRVLLEFGMRKALPYSVARGTRGHIPFDGEQNSLAAHRETCFLQPCIMIMMPWSCKTRYSLHLFHTSCERGRALLSGTIATADVLCHRETTPASALLATCT